MNFLILHSREPSSHAAKHQSWAYSHRHPRPAGVEVPLDAAETKLEDCQRDIGKNLRDFPGTVLKLSQMWRPVTEAFAEVAACSRIGA